MKKILFLLAAVILGCKSDDPGFTSPEGHWEYATPDLKIKVTFEVVKTGAGVFDIQHQTLEINGTSAQSEKEVVGFTATTIERIRINANDSKVVYPYNIQFNTATISGDFKTINVPSTTYTYPWGTTNSLTDIIIKRQ